MTDLPEGDYRIWIRDKRMSPKWFTTGLRRSTDGSSLPMTSQEALHKALRLMAGGAEVMLMVTQPSDTLQLLEVFVDTKVAAAGTQRDVNAWFEE